MKPEGRSADEILAYVVGDNSACHFFQAMSWLDLAKRTQKPAALHYTAFELRYGIEYLLFELLILANRNMTEAEYQNCLGAPQAMKKALGPAKLAYEKLANFTRILLTFDRRILKIRYWKLDEIFKAWGIASELLHFVGAHSRTYASEAWFVKSLARLESVLTPIWKASTSTLGTGLIAQKTMEPEVIQAWQEFSAGTLNEEDLKIRMKILLPILKKRKSQIVTC